MKLIERACLPDFWSRSRVQVCVAWVCLSAQSNSVILDIISFRGLVIQILDFQLFGIALNM